MSPSASEVSQKNKGADAAAVDAAGQAVQTPQLSHAIPFDFNGGIRGKCKWCGEAGFVYWNASLSFEIPLCDPCRDDVDRRTKASLRRAEAETTTPEQHLAPAASDVAAYKAKAEGR